MNIIESSNEKWLWLVTLITIMVIGYTELSILAYVLTLLFFVISYVNPKYGMLLIFIYVPIREFVSTYNPALSYLTEALVFGALFKVFWMNRKSIKNLFRFKNFEYAYFAFLLIGSISALVMGISFVSIAMQLRQFLLFYFIYYIVYRLEITRKDLINLIWIFIWTSLLLIIQAISEKLSIRNFFLPQSWEEMPLSAKNRVRIYGMLGNPNALGIFVMFAFTALYFAKQKMKEFNPRYLDIINVLLIGILVLTYSRGTWGGFLIAAISFIILTKKWKILLDITKYLVISLLLVVLPLNLLTNFIEETDFGAEKVTNIQQFDVGGQSGFRDRIGTTFSDDTVTGSKDSGRLFIVQKGFEIFKDYPVIGTGFATFGDSTTLSAGSPLYEEYEIGHHFYSDNQYIQIIVQTGVLGVIAFAAFLLLLLWRYLSKHKENYLYSLVTSLLLGAYFMGLVYNLWEDDVFVLSFFALIAAASRLEDYGIKSNYL